MKIKIWHWIAGSVITVSVVSLLPYLYTDAKIMHGQVSDLPLIGEIQNFDGDEDLECISKTIISSRAGRVCALGKASKEQFQSVFPVLRAEDSAAGANSLNSLIPPDLLLASDRAVVFDSTDTFWICSMSGFRNNRIFSIYAGYSESTTTFYFEYRWER